MKLELQECQIESVSLKAFVGLTKLEWLAMDKNFLTSITHLSFLPLANINGLDIHQNPWNCTCHMKPFMQVGDHILISCSNYSLFLVAGQS